MGASSSAVCSAGPGCTSSDKSDDQPTSCCSPSCTKDVAALASLGPAPFPAACTAGCERVLAAGFAAQSRVANAWNEVEDDEGPPEPIPRRELPEGSELLTQAHCFAFDAELAPEERSALYEQFDRFGLPKDVRRAFEYAADPGEEMAHDPPSLLFWWGKVMPAMQHGANLSDLVSVKPRIREIWRAKGLQAIRRGQVGVLLLSGREDVFLGLGPGTTTATVDIGLPSRKSILQLLVERLRRLQHLVSQTSFQEPSNAFQACRVPLYVMCSRDTVDAVESFLVGNDHFGLPMNDVVVFVQDEMPLVDRRGQYLLRSKNEVWSRPDGSGGLYRAVHTSGAMADMKSRMLEHIFVLSGDNALAKIADPTLIGHAIQCHVDVALKCMRKLEGEEPLPVFLNRKPRDTDGTFSGQPRPQVLGHQDLPPECRSKQDESGHLVFEAACLCQYVLRLPVMDQAEEETKSRWHVVEHGIEPCISPYTGYQQQRRAFRLELRVGDIVEWANRSSALLVVRDLEFAPVSEFGYSPRSACATLARAHQLWLVDAGARFQNSARAGDLNDIEGNMCEVSPLVSYEGEGLPRQYHDELHLPIYMPSAGEFRPSILAAAALWTDEPNLELGDDDCEVSARISTGQVPLVPHELHGVQDAIDEEEEYATRAAVAAQMGPARAADAVSVAKADRQSFYGITAQSEECLPDLTAYENERLIQEAEEASYNLHIITQIEDGTFQAELAPSSGTSSTDSSSETSDSTEPDIVAAGAEDAAQKRKQHFVFSKRGARNPIYEAARSTRLLRAKVFGKEYFDKHLQNHKREHVVTKSRRAEMQELYTHFNWETAYKDSWQEVLRSAGHPEETAQVVSMPEKTPQAPTLNAARRGGVVAAQSMPGAPLSKQAAPAVVAANLVDNRAAVS